LALAVLPLTVAMIEPSLRTVLVPAVGGASLTLSGLLTAGEAAIALSAIPARAEEKYGMTFAAQTNPQPENRFALHRHARWPAGLDNGSDSVAR
jgi:hypothetical protein